MKLVADILNEIDDIFFSSILMGILMSVTVYGFDYSLFFRFFLFFFIYLLVKIVFLKEMARILYYDHVEFYALRRPEKIEVETPSQALIIGISKYLSAAPSLFFTFLSLITFGRLKIPLYGTLDIKVSFSNVKGGRRQASEKCTISLLSILFDIFFALFLYLIGSDIYYVPILTSTAILIPYFSTEGSNLFIWKRWTWLSVFSLQFLSSLSKNIIFSVFSLFLILFSIWVGRKT